MSLKMKFGRFAGPLNCCEWCEFSSRSWHLFEQHLNRCQHGRPAVAKADAETKGSPLQKRRRNYRCNSCDFHAQRPKPLLQHVKEAHQPDLEIYSCELCNYASRFKHKVTQHKKVAHDKVLLPVPVDGADSHSVDDMLVLKQELGQIQADDEVVFSTAAPAKKRNHSYLTKDCDASDCLTKMKLVKCPKISKEAPQEFQAADRRATSSGISSTETRFLLSLDDEDHCQEPSTESQSSRADNRKEARAQAAVGPDISNLITKEVGPKTGENGGLNHPKAVRYKCQLCSYLNSHKLAVVKHLRSIHGKKIGHFCTKCEFIANSKVELSRHILTHSRRKHKCPDCLFITVKKRDFLEHRACHVISGPYSCSTCSFCSTSESVILAHKAEHHLQDETLDLKKKDHGKPPITKVQSLQYACDLCSAAFQNQSDVLEHMSAVHPSTCLFKCAICKRVFKNRRCLNIHIKLAHGLSASDRHKSSDKSRKTDVSMLPGTASEENSSLLTKMEAAELSEKKSNCIKEGLKVKIKRPVKAKKKLKLSKSIHLKHSIVSDDKSLVKLSVSQNLITSNYDEKSQKELEVMPILEQQIDPDLFSMSDEQAQSGIKIAGDGSKFICVKCDMTLTSKTGLECHLSRYHLGSVLYNCPFCSYKCLWKLSIKNHLKIHRNISKSVDNMNQLIDQSFCLSGVAPAVPGQKPVGSHDESVLSDSMTEASLQPSPLSPYKANSSSDCEHVSKKNRNSHSRLSSVMDSGEFEMKEEVNRDVAAKLRVDEKKADKFYCSTCNMNCDSASRLARHKERHADLKRFKCSLCGVRSNWDFYIRHHIQKCHAARGGKMKVLTEDEARRTIEEYNRRPKGSHMAKSTLDLKTSHKDKHGNRRHDFKKAEHNKIADASVGSKPVVENNSKVPMPVPSDRRKYHNWFCDQCPFATDSPSKLASHKEAHEDLKRFLCPVCGKRSNWVLYIQAHIRKAHRSSKAKAVELTHEEARQTLSDYLSQGRNYFLPGSRKSQSKLKKPKQKFSSKTTVNSETNSMKKTAPKEVLDEKTDYLQDVVGFSENFEDSCSNKDSLLQVGSLDDCFASVSNGHSSDSKTCILNNRSSSGQIQGNAFCRYKRYKCSVCGMRTNWPAALRRHKLSMHPHAKTVKLPVGEAKATLDLYENRLKHEIFVSNILAKSDGDVKNKVSSETKTQPVTAKQFLKKRKPPSSTMMFGCSHCDYKSKWKNNVYKHAKHVHPGAKIISCKAKPVKSKDYSCSECGLKSESVIALRKHVQSVHTSTRTSGLESSQSKAAMFPIFSDSAFDSLALDSSKEPLDASAFNEEQYSQEKCFAQLVHPSEPQKSAIDGTVLNAGRIVSYQKNWMASELPHSVNTALMSKFRRPRNFSCSGCPYRGDRRLYVLNHIRSVHAKSNCHVIHIRNRNRPKLMPKYQRRLPQSLQINREAMHQCDVCPYRATRLNRLEKHRGLHTAKPGCSYECTICPYYCPSSYCLEKHMLWHKTKTSTNSDGQLLSDHAYSQILPGVNKRFKFTCEKCPYMSGNCQHFLYHKQFHRPSPSAAYKCDVCPFWVAEKRMIVQHAKLHQCSTSQPSMQSEETGMLDDVVETARVKWDIIAAKCVPTVENKTAPLAPPSGDGRANEIEGRTARNKSSSPRSLLSSKSFTEMWLSGSLVGSGNASRLEENSMDSLESSKLASKYSSTDDLVRNGRLKENDSDINKFDRRSISNASGDFDLPAARSWHCEKCPYLTTFLINFKRHMSLHGSQQKYECQFCDYSVPRYYLLLQHRKLHFAPNRNLLFSQTINSLQRVAQLEGGREELLKEITHVAATGSASEPVFYEDTLEFRFPSKLFRCDDCPYSTTQHKSFAAHQKRHTVASAYNCPYCSYSVGKERLLNSHVIEHFNVPGCEMSAYSSAEAPELLESMKATILLLSGIRSTLEVTKEAVDCSEIKAEVEPVTEKPKPEECYDSKDILFSVDNEAQMKLTSVANNDLKVAESQIKCEPETSKPGQSIDNDDDDDLILILETNPGSQEDLTGPGDGGSTHDDGTNDAQLALEVESVEDATSEKESDDFEAKPALDIPAVNRDKHIDSSGRKAGDYHCDSQNGFEILNADLEEDKETGSKSETDSSIRVIDPTAMDCVIVTSREESNGLVALSTDEMHLADDEHRSAAVTCDSENSDIEDTFILLISDSEPETALGDGNEVGMDCEEERFGS